MLYIIITDFNGYDQTKICLRSLRKSQWQEFRVLVVDHGTTDALERGLRESFPWVLRVRGSSDDWWAGACNLGIKYAIDAGASSVLLLNNDCYVTPDCLSFLWAAHELKPYSIISSRQRKLMSRFSEAGSATYCLALGFLTIPDPVAGDFGSGDDFAVRKVRLICGGRGCLIPIDVFDVVGFFDSCNLPHYYADHDFFIRARRMGFDLYISERSIVDVDDARTTIASDLESMSLKLFFRSMSDPRSHRNLNYIYQFLKKNHPIPSLAFLAVGLMVVRYFLVFCFCKLKKLILIDIRD